MSVCLPVLLLFFVCLGDQRLAKVALIAPEASKWGKHGWVVDPIAAVFMSMYIIYTWLRTIHGPPPKKDRQTDRLLDRQSDRQT